MTGGPAPSWPSKVRSAVVVLVLAGIGAQVAAGLLVPLIPTLAVVLGLIVLYGLLVRR